VKKVQTPRSVLEDVVKFLNGANEVEAENLWAVLTAFRGSDSTAGDLDNTNILKERTTSIIRGIVGLDQDPIIDGVCDYRPFTVENPEKPIAVKNASWSLGSPVHFHHHVRRAVNALRNMGYTVNTQEETYPEKE
jgi:hypothetical protein